MSLAANLTKRGLVDTVVADSHTRQVKYYLNIGIALELAYRHNEF